jgi:CRISPR-associated protein Csm1
MDEKTRLTQQTAFAGLLHGIETPERITDVNLRTVAKVASRLASGEARDDPLEPFHGPLQSILDSIKIGNESAVQPRYFSPAPFSMEALGNYIKTEKMQDQNPSLASGELRRQLNEAITNENGESELGIERTLALIQNLAWCLPSSAYMQSHNVSLYDHARMTAALSAILCDLPGKDLQTIEGDPVKCIIPAAMLIGGDLSGVQDFIYTITNKGATASLRGRSFYLQLLTEAATHFILRELLIFA